MFFRILFLSIFVFTLHATAQEEEGMSQVILEEEVYGFWNVTDTAWIESYEMMLFSLTEDSVCGAYLSFLDGGWSSTATYDVTYDDEYAVLTLMEGEDGFNVDYCYLHLSGETLYILFLEEGEDRSKETLLRREDWLPYERVGEDQEP